MTPPTATSESDDHRLEAPADAALVGDGRVVEFYRVDPGSRIPWVLVASPIPVSVGLLLVAKPMYATMEPWTAWVVGVLSLMLVVVGPALMIWNLRLLRAEDYLLVRTDGLLDHRGTHPVLHRWEDIEAVVYDGSADAVVLQYRDTDPVRLTGRYAGIGARDLARRLDEVRRKSLFDLI